MENIPSVVVIDIKASPGILDDIAEDIGFEVSSMGVRVDETALLSQLEKAGCMERKGNVFRTDALVDEIGGFSEKTAD